MWIGINNDQIRLVGQLSLDNPINWHQGCVLHAVHLYMRLYCIFWPSYFVNSLSCGVILGHYKCVTFAFQEKAPPPPPPPKFGNGQSHPFEKSIQFKLFLLVHYLLQVLHENKCMVIYIFGIYVVMYIFLDACVLCLLYTILCSNELREFWWYICGFSSFQVVLPHKVCIQNLYETHLVSRWLIAKLVAYCFPCCVCVFFLCFFRA